MLIFFADFFPSCSSEFLVEEDQAGCKQRSGIQYHVKISESKKKRKKEKETEKGSSYPSFLPRKYVHIYEYICI